MMNRSTGVLYVSEMVKKQNKKKTGIPGMERGSLIGGSEELSVDVHLSAAACRQDVMRCDSAPPPASLLFHGYLRFIAPPSHQPSLSLSLSLFLLLSLPLSCSHTLIVKDRRIRAAGEREGAGRKN